MSDAQFDAGPQTAVSQPSATLASDAPASEPIAEAGRHFLVRRDIAFLNHGSFGACPAPVFDVYQRWQRELQSQPVEFLGRRLTSLLEEARVHLAAYIGARAENLVFVPNTTTGINIISRSLPLAAGDEVLATDHEYGAVERTWRYICGQRGAHYRRQPIPLPMTTRESFVEQLWQGVTERTRVLVVSHITSPTALIFPVAEVVRRAQACGIVTVIDGAHAPSQLDLDLETLGADFYVGNCHKWLSAPVGAAFLYVRPERHPQLQPLVVSWGYDPDQPSAQPLHDYFAWVGTDDPSAYLSVPAAIAFQVEHDWPRVRASCHTLAAQARERIAALTGLPSVCSDEWFSQMCVARLPLAEGVTREEVHRRLWDEFQVEVPITDWGGQRFVRVSIQAYNSPRDVDRLLDALSHVL
jgi:isopenicillin-N epimerase